MIYFILTFTFISAISGYACGWLAYEPVYVSRRGLHYRDVMARRSQSAAFAVVAGTSAHVLSWMVVSVAYATGGAL